MDARALSRLRHHLTTALEAGVAPIVSESEEGLTIWCPTMRESIVVDMSDTIALRTIASILHASPEEEDRGISASELARAANRSRHASKL